MCIHTTITFSCGHKFHKRESTTPECVLSVHDTPPVDEKRDGQCNGCKARNTLQLPAGKSEKKGLLRRALSVVSGASAKKKGAREEARKEEERLAEWGSFLNTNVSSSSAIPRSPEP